MSSSGSTQREQTLRCVERSECMGDVSMILKLIDYDKLKEFVRTEIKQETNDSKINKIYYLCRSIEDIFSDDIIKFIIRNLSISDLCLMKGVSKSFRKRSEYMLNNQLMHKIWIKSKSYGFNNLSKLLNESTDSKDNKITFYFQEEYYICSGASSYHFVQSLTNKSKQTYDYYGYGNFPKLKGKDKELKVFLDILGLKYEIKELCMHQHWEDNKWKYFEPGECINLWGGIGTSYPWDDAPLECGYFDELSKLNRKQIGKVPVWQDDEAYAMSVWGVFIVSNQ